MNADETLDRVAELLSQDPGMPTIATFKEVVEVLRASGRQVTVREFSAAARVSFRGDGVNDDTCSECGDSTDDGEGHDGYCSACAGERVARAGW
ncbi:MAG: hypothetical protein ACYCZN_01550 [Candidatus Dormibacteria bacterium]